MSVRDHQRIAEIVDPVADPAGVVALDARGDAECRVDGPPQRRDDRALRCAAPRARTREARVTLRTDEKIAVIGLGYVGLPVALAFARKFAHVSASTSTPRASRS